MPSQSNLLHYDAYWYFSIKEFGYYYQPNAGNNAAFFPLFPLVWSYFDFSNLGISLFNLAVFGCSFVVLLKVEKLKAGFLLMLLSFPSFIFFALPYSESLFFLFCTILIIGYRKKSNLLICIGLFGASLVRSVCMIFLPAIIICELLTATFERNSIIKAVCKLLASTAGFLLASWYLKCATGKWFYFIEIQKYWNRHWLVPTFPLTTISPARVLGVDAVTLLLGCIAIYICIKAAVIRIRRKVSESATENRDLDPSVLMSALYMSGMSILDVVFSYKSNGGTNIWSLNRHVMCTPFALIFLVYLFKHFNPLPLERLGLALLIVLGVFFTGAFEYPNLRVLGFLVMFFSTLIALKHHKAALGFFVIYYLLAIFLQTAFYAEFLNKLWLG
ncbi:hypothetical protein [Mucilaginibacter sp. dw_454]|uniref:hypothetical protein n=1 Tax=Mucilaginibacter sp. dw_454 TaxID=2720079 RepID=UPI001BD3BB4C|nr:hypothetical protein [Mucilaginibacter sp. dw_454]